MVFQAEDCWALRGIVAADAFEYGRAVADHVGEDVNLGVVPVDKFSVVPDLFGLWDGHPVAPLSM